LKKKPFVRCARSGVFKVEGRGQRGMDLSGLSLWLSNSVERKAELSASRIESRRR